MEAFGKVHPSHRRFDQWDQMSSSERRLQVADQARVFVDTAERFEHDAILLRPRPARLPDVLRLTEEVRRISGDRFFLLLHGDATLSIPNGADMEELSLRMSEKPEHVDAEAEAAVDRQIETALKLQAHGALDGFALNCDYCFNSGSFLPLPWFDRFVLPHLKRLVAAYREMGFYAIKHTDGNIMPLLDRLVEARPHALHSLDPQGGVDMAEVVRRAGDKVCLIGNVDCGKLQTGTDEECVESARYACVEGKKAPGYIFSTSNCVYTGMDLERYELILDVWRKEGVRS
jgi:uroporphyrinogen decarboxylase